MKKIAFTLLVAISSVLALYASSDAKGNIGLDSLMRGCTETKTGLRQDAVNSVQQSGKDFTTFEQVLDLLNFLFAVAALVIAIISFCVAVKSLRITFFSFRYTKLGYEASKRTADNVMRASFNVQKGQFDDLIRHLYRNLACTLAFTQKILKGSDNRKSENAIETLLSVREKAEHKAYPSEEHLLKLKVLPEDVLHLEKYNNDFEIYKKMHELKLLLRNYDIEIDTALMHLKNGNIDLDEVKNDLDTLTYKPLHIIKAILEITDEMKKRIDKKDKDADIGFNAPENAALIMTREHVKKLDDWEKKKAKFGKYADLTDIVPPFVKKENRRDEKPISKPYDGLRRSRNLFYDKSSSISALKKQDIFKEDADYRRQIEEICRKVTGLTDFKNNILSEQYDFKQYFLTMLSIDVTIELNNIHMIDIK